MSLYCLDCQREIDPDRCTCGVFDCYDLTGHVYRPFGCLCAGSRSYNYYETGTGTTIHTTSTTSDKVLPVAETEWDLL